MDSNRISLKNIPLTAKLEGPAKIREYKIFLLPIK
jgi:hypothetical protein